MGPTPVLPPPRPLAARQHLRRTQQVRHDARALLDAPLPLIQRLHRAPRLREQLLLRARV